MTFEEWEEKYVEQNTARSPLCPDYSYHDMQAAWLASRKAALEEAAKVCQSHEPKDFTVAGIITRAQCADAILALGDEP